MSLNQNSQTFYQISSFSKDLKIVRFIPSLAKTNFSIQATLQVVAVEAITSLIEMSAAIVLFLFGPQLLPASKRLLRDLKIQPSKNTKLFESQKDNWHRQNKTCSHPTKKTTTRCCPGSSKNHQNTKVLPSKNSTCFIHLGGFATCFHPAGAQLSRPSCSLRAARRCRAAEWSALCNHATQRPIWTAVFLTDQQNGPWEWFRNYSFSNGEKDGL